MHKEFVLYKVAQRLKKLGFNEPCFAYYNNDHALIFCPTLPDAYLNDTDDGSRMLGDECAAPLHQQASAWLRKNFGIQVHAEPEEGGKFHPILYTRTNRTRTGWKGWGLPDCDTYDLAIDSAMRRALADAEAACLNNPD